MWIDRNIFWSAVGVVMGAIGDQLPEAFKKDRSEFSGRPFDRRRLKAAQPMAREQTYAQLVLAEQMLRDGRPFLLGAAPSLADCALYNPVWFLQVRMGAGNTARAARPAAQDRRLVGAHEGAWQRQAHRHERRRRAGRRQGGDAGAARSTTSDPERPEGRPEDQRHAGRHRQGPGHGRAGRPDGDRVSIIRSDARVGDVVVHFPRAGFIISAL